MVVDRATLPVEERLRPTAPHDDLPFEELETRYNFRQTSDWVALFVRLLQKECRRIGPQAKVLDIGCGQGIQRVPGFTASVAALAGEMWGIEPDPATAPPEGIFDHHEHALLEDASLPEDYFDIAYSFMVLEHVPEPEAFFRAVSRCLRPGGVFLFATVNGAHYFARVGKLLRAVRLDEVVLRILRGKLVDEYHYPVQYRINTPRRIREVASREGFDHAQLMFVEEDGPRPYFPGPLVAIWWMLQKKRALIRRPSSLLTLYGRLTRAGAEPGSSH